MDVLYWCFIVVDCKRENAEKMIPDFIRLLNSYTHE